MAIITLTSDWGDSDYYVPAVKGALYSRIPDANIVDITHKIASFDVRSAAFIVKNCYKNFPEGTIHILAVDTEESIDNPHIVLKVNGHYFVGTDNSIFSMIIGDDPYEAVIIEVVQDTDFFTFSTRDRFVKVVDMIYKGSQLSDIGVPYRIKDISVFQPSYDANAIHGMVYYIDAYENIITNISKTLFESIRAGRKFSIKICSGFHTIKEIHRGYNDVQNDEIVALFGTHGLLEIAINHSNASSLLGMDYKSAVDIYFEDEKEQKEFSMF